MTHADQIPDWTWWVASVALLLVLTGLVELAAWCRRKRRNRRWRRAGGLRQENAGRHPPPGIL